MTKAFSRGTVHEAGEDLQAAVHSNPEALKLWESLTPLGRNEFICWVEDAKRPATRQRRIRRRPLVFAQPERKSAMGRHRSAGVAAIGWKRALAAAGELDGKARTADIRPRTSVKRAS